MPQEKIKVYWRPSCTTCRRVVEFLRSKKANFETVDIFKNRLSANNIREMLKLLGVSAKDILRKRDPMYKRLALNRKSYSDEELISFMVENPGLIQRPILVKGKRTVIALKPEMASELL